MTDHADVKDIDIDGLLNRIAQQVLQFALPIIDEMRLRERNPFKILVGTLLSARTKDETTQQALERLFALADNPADMASMSVDTLEKVIYPVGFYRTKAKNVKALCLVLLEKFQGEVPSQMESLLTLPGVGRKTANLVLALAFDVDAICVDTHVHRIMNRIGFVDTHTPQETEQALRERLPRAWWKRVNGVLVTFGQNICRPLSPKCSECAIESQCPQCGVSRKR